MSAKLTIMSPRGYRVVLKVNTNSALCLPLENACLQFSIEPSWFGLKHQKRCLDVSSTVKQSGIPNNCTLQLYRLDKERVASSVRTALVLPDGTRCTGVHEASVCLWDVLSAAESGGSTIPLCYPGGAHVLPCVEYCKVRVIGEEELRTKSLKSLGVMSGSAILRYYTVGLEDIPKTISEDVIVLKAHQFAEASENNYSTQETSAEAVLFPSPQTSVFGNDPSSSDPYISSVIKTPWSFDQKLEEEEKRRKQEYARQNPQLFSNPDGWTYDKGPFENVNLQDLLTQALIPVVPPEEDFISQFNLLHSDKTGIPIDSSSTPLVIPTPIPPTDRMQTSKPIERVYEEACPRDTCVFHLDMNEYSDVKPAEIDDSFFEPSINEVIGRQSAITHELTQLHDSPLTTHNYKRNQELSKSDKYEQTIIRVVLPNRIVLQGIFRSGEPIKSLVGYIRNCSVDPKAKFHLFTTPPKKIIKNGKVTFKEANLVPACNVYLALEEGEGDFVLKEELLNQVSSQLQADIRSCKERGVGAPSATPVYTQTFGSGKVGKTHSKGTNKGMPKWFKTGK